MTMKSVCVYCGSNIGKLPDYEMAAVALAKVLVQNNIQLIYGGASVGTMGAIADAALADGGEVIGIIPRDILAKKEVAHQHLTKMHVVETMHERKSLMAELADGFIAMPGGMGTMEELFEVITWGQLRFHTKPCAVLNVAGYYDHLTAFMAHAADQEFIRPEHVNMVINEQDPTTLVRRMQAYVPPEVNKWID